MRALAFALVVACSSDGEALRRNEEVLDVAAFHTMLASRDQAINVEKVRIETDGRGRARYVITLKTTDKRKVVDAEFPGTLVDEIVVAQIPYSAKPADHESLGVREKEMSAVTLRAMLANPDELAVIERIRIEPRADTARYEVTLRSKSVPSVAYAEYPGKLVTAIEASKVPFTVSAR